eukprot:4717281-Amphidinium_carterae.1
MGTTIVGVGPIGTLATDIGTQDSILGSSAHIVTPQAPCEVHALPTVPVLTPVPSEDVEMQDADGMVTNPKEESMVPSPPPEVEESMVPSPPAEVEEPMVPKAHRNPRHW